MQILMLKKNLEEIQIIIVMLEKKMTQNWSLKPQELNQGNQMMIITPTKKVVVILLEKIKEIKRKKKFIIEIPVAQQI